MNMIIAINRLGKDFLTHFSSTLEDTSLLLAWREYVPRELNTPVREVVALHKDMPAEDLNSTRTILAAMGLLNTDAGMESMLETPEFKERVEALLANKDILINRLKEFFHRRISVPTRHVDPAFTFTIHVVADLNQLDSFVLLNGLLLFLEDSIKTFVHVNRVKLILLGPETGVDLLASPSEKKAYASFLVWLQAYLDRTFFQVETYFCHHFNEFGMLFLEQFIKHSLEEKFSSKPGHGSILLPFAFHSPTDEEMHDLLGRAHDAALGRLLLLESSDSKKAEKPNDKAVAAHLEQEIKRTLAPLVARIRKALRKSGALLEFMDLSNRLIEEYVDSLPKLSQGTIRDYISGNQSIKSLEKMSQYLFKEAGREESKEIQQVLLLFEDYFGQRQRASWFGRVLGGLFGKVKIRNEDLSRYLDFYAKKLCKSRMSEELAGFLAGVHSLSNSASAPYLETVGISSKSFEAVVSHITQEILIRNDISSVKMQYCQAPERAFFLNKVQSSGFEEDLREAVMHDKFRFIFTPQDLLPSFWKRLMFPWPLPLNKKIVIVCQNSEHEGQTLVLLSSSEKHSTWELKPFGEGYSKTEVLRTMWGQVETLLDATVAGSAIFVQAGSFPLTSLGLRDWSMAERKDACTLEILRALTESVSPDLLKYFVAEQEQHGENGNLKTDMLDAARKSIFPMGIGDIRSRLTEAIEDAKLEKEKTVSMVNSLLWLEVLEKKFLSREGA